MKRLLVGLALMAACAAVLAGPWEDGFTASKRGDYVTAMRLWRPLADQGDAYAQFNLGVMYRDGQGVTQDYAEAVKWYRKAADQGDAVAQKNLGVGYYKGQGVPQDYVEAHKWLNLSAARATEAELRDRALKMRDNAAVLMSPAQIAEAQKLAREWRSNKPRFVGISVEPLANSTGPSGQSNPSSLTIPLKKEGGTLVVQVLINAAITLKFVVDSGATHVSIPADVVMTLMRTGTLRESDFLGKQTYVLADGSKVPSNTFRIRSLKVGSKTVENVVGSVAPVQGTLLLGQSFLSRFKSWSIDNGKQALILE